jgi:hypothetical protein
MKLRIKGNSVRLRVTPSEVKQLLRDGSDPRAPSIHC